MMKFLGAFLAWTLVLIVLAALLCWALYVFVRYLIDSHYVEKHNRTYKVPRYGG